MAINRDACYYESKTFASTHSQRVFGRASRTIGILLCVLVLLSSTVLTHGEYGPCTYEDNQCSCRMGDENQGTCYDLSDTTPGSAEGQVCSARFCQRGWTCSCHGRTHLCTIRQRMAMVADDPSQKTGTDINCHEESRNVVDQHFLELGSFKPSISRTGLLASNCTVFAWWHNGALMGNYGEDSISDSNVDEELDKRSNHSLLELRPGDLIAFRFRHASYYCYNSFSSFVVNGTAIDTTSSAISTHFARAHSTDWFIPETNVKFSEDEHTAELTDFVPLRKTKLDNTTSVVVGEDSWEPPDGTKDNAYSNFYFRIQL